MMFITPSPSNAPERRRGFTLVEILVSIVILGVISGMVAQALTGANRQAQQTRAQAFVNQLNLTMLQLYEVEAGHRVGLSGQAWSAEAAAQTQLIWRRDWLRTALPMSKADIDIGSGRSRAPALLPVPFLTETGRDSLPLGRRMAVSELYRSRVIRMLNATNWTTAFNNWTPENESAECLYLIFASNTINGDSLLGQLRTRDVADTDDDGMPEIVDPWQRPVAWMRSPVGFYLKNRWSANDALVRNQQTIGELKRIVASLGEDPLDILRTDPRTQLVEDGNEADPVDPTVNTTTIEIDKLTFFARPLIVSAGIDGQFDLLLTSSGVGRDTQGDDRIDTLASPERRRRNNNLLAHPLGYGNAVFFPDPFYSRPIVNASNNTVDGIRPMADRPGAVVDVNSNGIDESADNIYPTLSIL